MEPQYKKRSAFSGKIGFVLSAAGASVGLGNIWRFPYLAAKYGGGIFLLIYILLAFTFGYTMIVAETALGRMTKKSPVGAFAAFAGFLAGSSTVRRTSSNVLTGRNVKPFFTASSTSYKSGALSFGISTSFIPSR